MPCDPDALPTLAASGSHAHALPRAVACRGVLWRAVYAWRTSYRLRAVVHGEEAISASVVMPHASMLTQIDGRLRDDRFEMLVRDEDGRTLTLALSRRRIELLHVREHAEGASESAEGAERRGGASKVKPYQSESWQHGVAVRYLHDSDADFTLQLAARAKPSKRPPLNVLCASTTQQRDFALLALCAFARPEWLKQAQEGVPPCVGFVAPPRASALPAPLERRGRSPAVAAPAPAAAAAAGEAPASSRRTGGAKILRALSFTRRKSEPSAEAAPAPTPVELPVHAASPGPYLAPSAAAASLPAASGQTPDVGRPKGAASSGSKVLRALSFTRKKAKQ